MRRVSSLYLAATVIAGSILVLAFTLVSSTPPDWVLVVAACGFALALAAGAANADDADAQAAAAAETIMASLASQPWGSAIQHASALAFLAMTKRDRGDLRTAAALAR